MNILKNKHLILAMFVAPVLAIIAYFATDYVVSEKPRQAQQGNTYKLAANSNCRYQSGQCTLQNGDVEVKVSVERITDSLIELTLRSNIPVQKVLASFVADNITDQPTAMQSDAADSTVWQARFNIAEPEKAQLRLAMELSGALFYAETPAVFIDYDTAFSRDNFSE
jgi:uncharacterized protein involved in propanediol utilization